jgi:hypothetical protein
VAAIKQYVGSAWRARADLGGITCGANMNFDRLRFVAERADVGEEREALFAVTIPKQRGSFKKFCELIGPRAVTEFNYRISDERSAHVFVGIATTQRGEAAALADTFNLHGFQAIDLTKDELAKLHLRHMVGGRSELAADERLYRFVFPERPGALMKFLASLHPGWNISLFHYRNQGADYGRILVGIQVPRQDKKRPSASSCDTTRLSHGSTRPDNASLVATVPSPAELPARLTWPNMRHHTFAGSADRRTRRLRARLARQAAAAAARPPVARSASWSHLAVRLGLIQNTLKPRFQRRHSSFVFAADHGHCRRRYRRGPTPFARSTVETTRMLLTNADAADPCSRASQGLELTVVDCGRGRERCPRHESAADRARSPTPLATRASQPR